MSTATRERAPEALDLPVSRAPGLRPEDPRRRILVAMSGGVDSSVTAAVLHRAGHRVVGATMKTFCYSDVDGPTNTCCGLEGISDARSVASRMGFAHHVYDVEDAFRDDVIGNFVSEYAAGRTPIPCVRCNSFTKFRDLVHRADELGCDALATGHYARLRERDGEIVICRADDDAKDQTYFLWGIPREVVPRLVLPIGEMEKGRVRDAARELGLPVADKPDSYEICFVPDNDYLGVLRRYLDPEHPALSAGPFLTPDGREVGRHDGYAGFTVGQRKGLPGGFPRPMYVLEIRPEERAVVIGSRSELGTAHLEAGEANWLVADPPEPGQEVGVRVRHGAPVVEARMVSRRAPVDGEGAGFELELLTEQRAVTPGQSAALYRGDVLVGGGVIR